MEGVKELSPYAEDPLSNINIQIHSTSTSAALLKRLLSFILHSPTVQQFHGNLIDSAYTLDSLHMYSKCDIEVVAGETLNSATVNYKLNDLKWWDIKFDLDHDSEGIKLVSRALLRNLREQADISAFNLEYKYNTGTFGYKFTHLNQLSVPGKLKSYFTLEKYSKELDLNLSEQGYGGNIGIRSFDDLHTFEVGRYIRTYSLDTVNASKKLIETTLPVSSRNYISHVLSLDKRDGEVSPRSGWMLNIMNELSGLDSLYYRIAGQFTYFYPFTESLVFEPSFLGGAILAWPGLSPKPADLHRIRFIKGFNAIGNREPPVQLHPKLPNPGDDLGSKFFLKIEGKLHLHDTPILQRIGMVPFLYVNSVYLPASTFYSSLRGSLGFGVGWNLAIGRLEFSYASKVWKQPGDFSVDFLVQASN